MSKSAAKYITHIVAASGNAFAGQGVIGQNNALPWPRISADMKHFKAATLGSTIIMGRKTFESIGGKPLPGRTNFVLSRSQPKVPDGVKVFHSIQEAIRNAPTEKVFIIGGGDLYRQTMDRVDEIQLTDIPGPYQGDTFYPSIPARFKVVKREVLQSDPKIEVIHLKETPSSDNPSTAG